MIQYVYMHAHIVYCNHNLAFQTCIYNSNSTILLVFRPNSLGQLRLEVFNMHPSYSLGHRNTKKTLGIFYCIVHICNRIC